MNTSTKDSAVNAAVKYLRDRTRTCNTEASASMKRCSGDMTKYAESLIKEGEIAWRYADEIERLCLHVSTEDSQ